LLYWQHLPKTFPGSRFGLIDSTGDSVISAFFGFGASNCTSYAGLTPVQYEAALLDMRSQVQSYGNIGSFIFDGTDHTTVVDAYTTRTATASDGGVVPVEAWVSALVTSSVTNVGP
jgi:hypothetical protein